MIAIAFLLSFARTVHGFHHVPVRTARAFHQLSMSSMPNEDDVSPSTESSAVTDDPLSGLLRIASSTGRGEFATEAQKQDASSLIAQLESQNPTPNPTESNLINGKWELLYSSTQLFRSSPFFMAGRAVCQTEDEAKQYDWFCDMHRAALAISNIGAVRQIISPTGRMVSEFEVKVGAIPFLSDLTPFRYSGGMPVSRLHSYGVFPFCV